MRWAIGIEYDGSDWCGFQRQTHAPSIQSALEQALSRVAASPVRVAAAGRTDRGVHATAQVAHFDTPSVRPERAFTRGANTLLPPSIRVRWASPVPTAFHARHSARRRRYLYLLRDDVAAIAIGSRYLTCVRGRLDAARMQSAAHALTGEHDFSAFRAAGCQAQTPFRTVDRFDVRRSGALVIVDIAANAFLLHMVRNLVGCLLAVGAGERPIDWLEALLAARDRTLAAPTAPPQGLYLVEVSFDGDYGFDQQARLPWMIDTHSPPH